MAEVCLDLQPSGHWFGGGHFMRQLWPLDAASWETGPYYPFDNGPNGLNTLISPQWMTRYRWRCFKEFFGDGDGWWRILQVYYYYAHQHAAIDIQHTHDTPMPHHHT